MYSWKFEYVIIIYVAPRNYLEIKNKCFLNTTWTVMLSEGSNLNQLHIDVLPDWFWFWRVVYVINHPNNLLFVLCNCKCYETLLCDRNIPEAFFYIHKYMPRELSFLIIINILKRKLQAINKLYIYRHLSRRAAYNSIFTIHT